MRKFAVLGVFLVVFMSLFSTANAAVIRVYTDKTAWEDALGGPFMTEDFSDDVLDIGVSYYSSESAHINPANGYYQDVLASFSNNEPKTIWSFVPGIRAYGGNWTLGGPGGTGNSLKVNIVDSSTAVGSISNSYDGGFWGFISDTPFESVELIGGPGTTQQNYKLDDMVYSEVPEPATLSLLALSTMTMIRRRRIS